MVFSSIPAYLDPANWQQQPAPNHQHNGGISNAAASTQLLPPPPPPPPPPQPHGSGGAGSIRPGSMADRARMANIPMPETALKCPRCDSTNTKFCYFNNYSLSQPRHFCKTCRRYWTRGGALRSVPVGGGCRRNKRTKAGGGGGGSSSKSPAASGGDRQTCSSGSITSSGTADHIFGGPLRFMSPLHNFSDLGAAGDHNIGLNNYSGLNILGNSGSDLNFQSLSVSTGPTATSLYTMEQQWRLQQQAQSQFPFLGGGLDPSPAAVAAAGLLSYPFDQGGHVETSSSFLGQHLLRPKAPPPSSGASVVKMEDSHQNQHHQHHHHQHINQDHQLSLSRQLLGNIVGNDQFWSSGAGAGATATAWSDLSGFSSSSTSHP